MVKATKGTDSAHIVWLHKNTIVRALHMTAPKGVPASLVLFRTDRLAIGKLNTSCTGTWNTYSTSSVQEVYISCLEVDFQSWPHHVVHWAVLALGFSSYGTLYCVYHLPANNGSGIYPAQHHASTNSSWLARLRRLDYTSAQSQMRLLVKSITTSRSTGNKHPCNLLVCSCLPHRDRRSPELAHLAGSVCLATHMARDCLISTSLTSTSLRRNSKLNTVMTSLL